MLCQCRYCLDDYEESKSRADYKGYCSQRCLHAMAKQLGYRKSTDTIQSRMRFTRPGWGMSEFDILSRAKEVGSVPCK